jgi:hypothetical protein
MQTGMYVGGGVWEERGRVRVAMGPATYGFESILINRIALEEVWRVDLEAVASKVVDNKLTSVEQENERARRGRWDRTGSRGYY